MAKAKKKNDSGANLGFEAKLWLTADKMRNNMDAAEYKHVVLGLIFLKYISDAFEERRAMLEQLASDPAAIGTSRSHRNATRYWRIATSTLPKAWSGCPRWHAGSTCRPMLRSPPSAS
jgi:hypothetical protein